MLLSTSNASVNLSAWRSIRIHSVKIVKVSCILKCKGYTKGCARSEKVVRGNEKVVRALKGCVSIAKRLCAHQKVVKGCARSVLLMIC